ncbi:unnamed protein product [Closterium sp. NIES-65]|nr:unnamed protein product [Closterium sp. NIES-65]
MAHVRQSNVQPTPSSPSPPSLATSIGGRDPLPSPQLEQRGVKGDSQIVLCALMLLDLLSGSPRFPRSPSFPLLPIACHSHPSPPPLIPLGMAFPLGSSPFPFFSPPPRLLPISCSACAPMTAAVRLPPQSNAADRKSAAYSRALNAPLRPCPSRLVGLTPTREQRNCAALNAVCVKDRGDATCVCNVGFAMTPTGCVDTCVLKACGVNGKCVKDSAGAASCVCDTGFALQADGKTCTGTSFYVLLCWCMLSYSEISFLLQSGPSPCA